jgi:hypothetical protein
MVSWEKSQDNVVESKRRENFNEETDSLGKII